ncbi:MAG: glycosyltransferase [Patescibacteria group bacterium]|nr:glycosyltransferase [Patescibacteria group bacterium]
MNKISCIICAFNEEPRIGAVLNALKEHPLLDEVIVVDDGSTDGTKKIIEQNEWIRLISHPKNLGKSAAMCTGILNSKNDLLLFLDADLKDISAEDVTALAMPVLENKSDVSISTRKNSLLIYKILGFDFFSGERIISKKYLIDHIEEIGKLPGYAIETYINTIIVDNKLRVAIVYLKNVIHTMKAEKVGLWKGINLEIKMALELVKYSSLMGILKQNYKLLKLRVD